MNSWVPRLTVHPKNKRRPISAVRLSMLIWLPLLGACQTVLEGGGTMQSHGDVRSPRGYVSFCSRNPGECSERQLQPRRVSLTANGYREIAAINAQVNRRVRYVSDRAQYGTLDHWALPAGQGDCEDIALEKRRRLIALGYPRQALLLTLARTPRGNGHVVLVVSTDRSDYVLDNLRDDIVPWWALGYSWLVQQSRNREPDGSHCEACGLRLCLSQHLLPASRLL